MKAKKWTLEDLREASYWERPTVRVKYRGVVYRADVGLEKNKAWVRACLGGDLHITDTFSIEDVLNAINDEAAPPLEIG